MSRTIPTDEGDRLVAGDTWSWTKTLADYPPSEGWTLTYSFRGPSVLKNSDVVVTPGVSDYSVAIAAAKTAALKPGTYKWAAFVSNANGERYTADEGVLVVERNLDTAAEGDAVSHAEKMVAIIEAVLEGRAGADIQAYQHNGQFVTKIPVLELKRMLKQYRSQIWRQRNGNKLGPTHLTTFGRVSS